jgi:CubicO group peptidase (beta-lactamase class C family)
MKHLITIMKHLITIGALLLSILTSQGQTQKEFISSLNNEIPIALEKYKVPGLAIAIIENGKVIVKKGYGFANVGLQKKVTTKDGFNIGSISKMFTAWGVLKLVETGKVSLDTPISTYLKSWKLPTSSFDTSKITIRNVLNHSAGLTVHGYNGYNSKKEVPTLINSLNGTKNTDEKVTLFAAPNTKWKYSGGGYSMLQLLIEDVSGISFEKFMKRNIFKPLKMKNTSFTIDKKVIKNSAKAYDEKGELIPLRLFAAKAAAGLHTTLEDMILFAQASFKSNKVLSKKSIEIMTKATKISRGNYGFGYMIMNRFGNFTLSGHGGSNEGWQSGLMLDLKSNSGFIVLTNGSNGKNVLFGSMQTWAKWHGQNLKN